MFSGVNSVFVPNSRAYIVAQFLEKNNLWDKGNFSFLVCDTPKPSEELVEIFSKNTADEYLKYDTDFFKKIPMEVENNVTI